MKRASAPRSVIVVSDTHCGCRMGLFPDLTMTLDGGMLAGPSGLQIKVWKLWLEFWQEWVPVATKHEPYIVVVNGDALDGVHHGSKTQVSQNFADQSTIAHECYKAVLGKEAALYWMRGTEAHVGASGEQEELLARALGAKPDAEGHHARWELYLDLHGHLCHFTHHIGTTGSSAFESTAPYKEMVESYVDAGRWDRKPPQVIVRSHRHRHIEVRSPSRDGHSAVLVTPGWQLKTPFVYRIPGARASQPQIGGVLIRVGDRMLYTDSKVWSLDPPETESYHD
jgi:hypothetical protein